jgi:hypothetical protein
MFRKRRAAPQPVLGTLACDARGCSNQTAMRCEYVDKRGRACRSAFCPAHWSIVGGLVFCRRHGSTIKAIGENALDIMGWPDIDNRAPSLVNWIARELDDRVRGLLDEVIEGEERILVDRTVGMAYDQDRRRRWERSWKLVETTGLVMKISISVDEREDALVSVRVGKDTVAQGVPPWIARRHSGEDLDPDVDRLRRELFYRFLEENIRAAVDRLRGHTLRPSWVA